MKTFNSLFDEVFGDFSSRFEVMNFNEALVGRKVPEGMTWEVEMPGVEVKTLTVESSDTMIYINGVRKFNGKTKTYDYSIPLNGYGPEVEYSLKNGVLKVTAKSFNKDQQQRRKATMVDNS